MARLIFLFKAQGKVYSSFAHEFFLNFQIFVSEMKGKTAFELAKPESPVMALLARHQVPNGQVSQHMSLELNGHHSTFQSICNRSNDGAASPVETESVFSTEEVKSNIQMSSCLEFLKMGTFFIQ